MAHVAVNGLIYNYEKIEGSRGIPLLFLHGWGRSYVEWIRMGKELSTTSGRPIYVLDLPGFGGSSTPRDIQTIEDYADLVYKFCHYLEIEKVIIIGHSLGGRLGIVLAKNYPEFVEKLILVDPAGVKPGSLRRIALTSTSFLFKWVPKNIRRKLTEKLMDEDYQNVAHLRELYRVVVQRDLRRDLALIKCEVAVIWGENDKVLPLSLTKIYQRLLKNCQVRVIWGAGHDPHLTHYPQTLEVIKEMLP